MILLVDKDTSIRIDVELNNSLSVLAEKYSLSKNDIVAYLIDLAEKYDLIEPDWKDRIRSEIVTEITQATEDDEKLGRLTTIEKIKTINKAKLISFQEYLKVLDVETKKSFLEKLLMIKDNENWLDNLSKYQLIRINGIANMFQLSEDGSPIININPELIEPCQNGFHIKHQFCKCTMWKDCNIRSEEYQKYIENKPPSKQGKYIKKYEGALR